MPIDRALLGRLRIEPLDRNKHDRAAFSCGYERVDNFLKSTAGRQQSQDITRVYVACLDELPVVIGYYALNMHAIDISTLPADELKGMPMYSSLPAVYLSIVGVDRDYQGKGLGSFLMADAFRLACDVSSRIAARFIVLDALNEDAARLYRWLGFRDLPGHEPRMLISMAKLRNAIRPAK